MCLEVDVLITPDGYKLLSERLPRDPDQIEKIMADAAKDQSTPKPSTLVKSTCPGQCATHPLRLCVEF
ncbi:MAG TPA: hypothetical protein VK818_20020 [Methylomirabilota bacterium]|nr:hypothetical protein [Methylomirabilota bacterium]